MPQPALHLDQVSQPQQERLAYIEFRLLFLGCVNRSDLVNRFGLKEAAASRDLALYKQLASENITYDTVERTYRISECARPLFTYQPQQVLTVLAEGFGDDFVASCALPLQVEIASRLNMPTTKILAPVSRALFGGKSINVVYRSLSSGRTQRNLVPLALVDNGLRWHLRAYDHARERYADFVLNRMEAAELLDSDTDAETLRLSDHEWNQRVELALVPHPAQAHRDTIAFEYGMQDGQLTVSTRTALAGYLLRRWSIDCSANHRLSGPEHLLWLSNVKELTSGNESLLNNLTIAPGFDASAQDNVDRGIGC